MVKAFSRALAGTSFMWLLLAAAAAWVPNARAEATFRVVDTHPAGERVTLAPNETFYVRVAYTTDEPVRIWARPYFRGAEVRAGSNPSRVHTGSGEALGWFFLFEPGLEVDEIRITAGDGSTAGTRLVATKPVHIVSANRARAAESLPAWAVTLRDEENRLAREDMERRMAEPVGVGSHLLMTTFMFAVLGLGIAGIVLPLRAVRRWQGGWRVAAAIPLAIIGFVVLRIVIDTAIDPTSHNLWPFEVLQAAVISLLLIGVIVVARKVTGAAA
ncbi:MAG TPA: hypothetical protein VKZ85_11470 [Woeseiaceae bacterium]|nr:hypothetical protein [Woeseiaceae bacterium]